MIDHGTINKNKEREEFVASCSRSWNCPPKLAACTRMSYRAV
jgi:hypothetical protein